MFQRTIPWLYFTNASFFFKKETQSNNLTKEINKENSGQPFLETICCIYNEMSRVATRYKIKPNLTSWLLYCVVNMLPVATCRQALSFTPKSIRKNRSRQQLFVNKITWPRCFYHRPFSKPWYSNFKRLFFFSWDRNNNVFSVWNFQELSEIYFVRGIWHWV